MNRKSKAPKKVRKKKNKINNKKTIRTKMQKNHKENIKWLQITAFSSIATVAITILAVFLGSKP